MPKVVFLDQGRAGAFADGTTLLAAADALRVAIGRVCGGQGTCSTCRVEVVAGAEHLSAPEENEIAYDLPQGQRLACQSRVAGDVGVRVVTIPRAIFVR